ncbi:conserved hypothetical protein [Hyphomicrobiales bacterium]|nr:conserved hypothetical protein [Hyphomicrobiales bacterium]CAH1702927.1 conserved hypothetical protein [Hyphomicrobiales bacterium]CAI0347113.1 conserved hypothetical protein [Hyphomicrobiales bacterium]
MPREFRNTVEPLLIQTAKGRVKVTPIASNEAYVRVENDDGVVIRGIPVTGSEHFVMTKDGITGRNEMPNSRFTFKGMRSDRVYEEAPAGTSRELLEVMRGAVETAALENARTFAEAGTIAASNNLLRVEENIAKKREELQALFDERAKLAEIEAEAEEALAQFEPQERRPGM